MPDLLSQGISGQYVDLQRTNPRHMLSKLHPQQQNEKTSQDFGSVLTGKLQEVNQLSQDSLRLSQQFITEPDSVDAHDVTIAMGKANLAVSLTKSVVDGALKAYREIVNLR